MFTLLNRLSVSNRIWGIVLIFIGSIVVDSAVDLISLRETLQQEKESTIRHLVEGGHSVLAHYEELERNGTLSRDAAQAAALATVRRMRYSQEEYFWINDDQVPSRMIMHPIIPELEGKPVIGERFNRVTSLRSGVDGPLQPSTEGKNLTEAFADVVAQTGHGYVAYQWPKAIPGGGSTAEDFPKLSYVKKFAPWGWIIGSGIYIDDIDAAVRTRTIHHLLMLFGVSSALLLLAGLLARSITRPLRTTMRAMHDIAQGGTGFGQRLPVHGPSEIAKLASNFNGMLDHIQARDRALLKHQEDLEGKVASRTASLHESRNRMHALLDATDESVMLLTLDGTILEINVFAARRFGRTSQTMVGTNFFDYLPAPLAKARRAMLQAVGETGEAAHYQDQRDAIFFDNSLYPVKDENGAVESIAVYAKDVTEQRRIRMDEDLFQQLGMMLMRWGVNSEAVAQIFCDGILPVFNLSAAFIAVAGQDGRISLLAGSEGIAGSAVANLPGVGDTPSPCLPIAAVMANRERQIFHLDAPDCADCEKTASGLGAAEAILLPLIIDDACWGVLVLYGHEAGRFADGLLQQRLLAAANRLVITLESALRQERLALLELALAQASSAVMITDARGNIVEVNRSMALLSGYAMEELIGQPPKLFNSGHHDAAFYKNFWQTINAGKTWRGEIVNRRKDGSLYTANQIVTPLSNADGQISHYIAVIEDISERKRQEKELQQNYQRVRALNEQLENAQNQLLQSEKMASIGQLAAGVAHEINNPIGFVSSNLGTLKEYVDDLLDIIQAYGMADSLLAGRPEIASAVETLKEKADLDFLREDVQTLVRESRDGIDRVTGIVQNLKEFSRIDSKDWAAFDLEQGLDSTLNIVANQIRGKVDIVREYSGVPPVECLGSQLNQVFMNLLLNAAQAIETHGTITIRTGQTPSHAWVEIADTGRGIPPEIQQRIFEPFFTTKAIGQGTGLGLSLAYSIVQKHHGRLTVASEPGVGSRFRIEIPCVQPNADASLPQPSEMTTA